MLWLLAIQKLTLSLLFFLHNTKCCVFASFTMTADDLITLPNVGVTRIGKNLTFNDSNFNTIAINAPLLDNEFVLVSVEEGNIITVANSSSTSPTSFHSSEEDPLSRLLLQGTMEEINTQLQTLTYIPPTVGGRYSLTIDIFATGESLAKTQSILKIVVHTPLDESETRDALTKGVSRIHSGEHPSAVISFGLEAYDVIMFESNVADGRAAVGAASFGQGRAVLMADHQMIKSDYVNDSQDFYHRALAWLVNTSFDEDGFSRNNIRVVTYDAGFHNWLSWVGYDSVLSNSATLETDLVVADVFVGGWIYSDTDNNLELLKEFAAMGGGLFLCDAGYGWRIWWNKPLYEAPSNFILREAGLAVTDNYIWTTGVLDVVVPTNRINAETVLDIFQGSTGNSELDKLRGGIVLEGMYEALPPSDPLLAQIDFYFLDSLNTIRPTPTTPVGESFDKAILSREKTMLRSTLPEEVLKHRTVEDVYGVVPENAPRVTDRTVQINLSRTRWQPTGYYAAPGEVVTLNFPAEMVGVGYTVRVNAHTDDISGRPTWERPPYVHRKFDIEADSVMVANAFGGAIFIDLGGGSHDDVPEEDERVTVGIDGAVEHPFFVHGVHTNEDWEDIKNKPAPFAVFMTDDLTIVQRSEEHQKLKLPHELMDFWNKTMELQTYIAGRTKKRSGMEIINVDIQISHGAAHAGFPIQAYDEHWVNLADYDKLMKDGSWGDYHELGHNLQRGWWTFSDDTEVTVNIFSIYCLRTLNPEAERAWTYAEIMMKARDHISYYNTYANMGIWERLIFWVQLMDGFGVEKMKNVFESYEIDNDKDPSRMPNSEVQKRDQWLLRFSDMVGLDLSKFMVDYWGLEVSPDALSELEGKGYKTWMPAVASPYHSEIVHIAELHSIEFNMNDLILSLDDLAEPIITKKPKKGTLTAQTGDSGIVWTYTPSKKFRTEDSFKYTGKSSSGHSQGEPMTITIKLMKDATLIDLMEGLQYESKRYKADQDSFYFLFRDEDVGPTKRVWWGSDNDFDEVTVMMHSEPGSCSVKSVEAKFKGQQKGLWGYTYPMSAGRSSSEYMHSLILTAELADNGWLNDESYSGCKFHSVHVLTVDVMHWHNGGGTIDEINLHFFANIPGRECTDDVAWNLNNSKKNCAWLKNVRGNRLEKTCGRKGIDGKTGHEACPLACDADACAKPSCVVNDDWQYVKGNKSYNCKRTKKKKMHCKKVGTVNGVLKFGYEVCKSCKKCEKSTARSKLSSDMFQQR